ncbi:MAG: tetratricopeptide repeat protein [Gemmatimonadaceae bacterium]
MTKTGTLAPFEGDVAEARFEALFERHKRHLGWFAVVLILIGGGTWFYLRSESIKSQRAEAAFEAAMQSVSSGNLPLAQSDLKAAATRYAGTNGGTESSMALAKILYQQDKFQEGIAELKDPAGSKGDMQYEAMLLTAAGYEGLTKWSEAAKEYEAAAEAARFPADKANAQAMAARSYQQAGDKAAAEKIWQALLADAKSGFASEAKIRLGELQAVPAKA